MSSIRIDDVIRAVAELPDRDSPEGQPEIMLASADALREILEAQLAARVAPAGYKLVPIEMTPEMQQAGAQAIRFDTTILNKLWTGNAVYRDMIAAVPVQPETWKVLPSPPAVMATVDAAIAMVPALCNGSQRWTMSVPARLDSDPDLVIAGALQNARVLIGRV
jgi:hypothetical protein